MAKYASDVIKKTGKTDGQSNKLGKGGRFKQMEKKGLSPKLSAWIGDKVHGKGNMKKWAVEGKKDKK